MKVYQNYAANELVLRMRIEFYLGLTALTRGACALLEADKDRELETLKRDEVLKETRYLTKMRGEQVQEDMTFWEDFHKRYSVEEVVAFVKSLFPELVLKPCTDETCENGILEEDDYKPCPEDSAILCACCDECRKTCR